MPTSGAKVQPATQATDHAQLKTRDETQWNELKRKADFIRNEAQEHSANADFANLVRGFAHEPVTKDIKPNAGHKRPVSSDGSAPLRKRITRSSAQASQSDQFQSPAIPDSVPAPPPASAIATATGSLDRKQSNSRALPAYQSLRVQASKTDAGDASRTKREKGNPKGVVSKLNDALDDDLLVLFVGVNPGIKTAETGHAYAHPSNLYWRLLHASGLTPRRMQPSETHSMPRLLRYGNTNLVERPTKDASSLSKAELDAGVLNIEMKAAQCRAEVVCLVGKGIWEAVERVWKLRGRKVAPFKYGFRPERETMGSGMGAVALDMKAYVKRSDWAGARVFVATTTSGLAAGMNWAEKLAVWKELGDWVQEYRRNEVQVEGTKYVSESEHN